MSRVSLRAAFGLIAREPVAVLTLIFALRLCAIYDFSQMLLAIVPLGYLTVVLRGALQDDAVPLPGLRALPATTSLGCAAWVALGATLLMGALVTMFISVVGGAFAGPIMPTQWLSSMAIPFMDFRGTPSQLSNPLNYLAWALVLWMLASVWVGVALNSREGIWSRLTGEHNVLGCIVATFFAVLLRPPLNRDGAILIPLACLMLATSPWHVSPQYASLSSLATCVPVICGVLCAHCLGQYVRRVVGTELE